MVVRLFFCTNGNNYDPNASTVATATSQIGDGVISQTTVSTVVQDIKQKQLLLLSLVMVTQKFCWRSPNVRLTGLPKSHNRW